MFALGIAGLALLGLLVAVRLASANGRDPDAPEVGAEDLAWAVEAIGRAESLALEVAS